MRNIHAQEIKNVHGGALWMVPVGVYIWYEFGGGKEAIANL